jgi:hypothetical protein
MEGLWEASDDAAVLGGGAEEAISDLIQREEEEKEGDEEGGRGRSSSSGRRGVSGEIDGDWNAAGKQKKRLNASLPLGLSEREFRPSSLRRDQNRYVNDAAGRCWTK